MENINKNLMYDDELKHNLCRDIAKGEMSLVGLAYQNIIKLEDSKKYASNIFKILSDHIFKKIRCVYNVY